MRVIALFIFLLAIAFSSISFAEKLEPIKIGAVYGFTGWAQKWGKYGRNGAELAVEEINAAGGVAGRPIEVVFEDNQTDPKKSVSAYKKLIHRDKVDAVIASSWAMLTNPIIPLTKSDKVVTMSPTVMDSSITSESDYFFTMGHRIESQRAAIEKFFTIHPQVRSIAVLCWDDDWGRANLALWEQIIKEKRIRIVYSECFSDMNEEFRAPLLKVMKKKPDALFAPAYIERIVRRMRELGMETIVAGSSEMMEKIYDSDYDPNLFNGIFFADWHPGEEFQKKYREKVWGETNT